MEKQARNYNGKALVDDGSCIGENPCVMDVSGSCTKCNIDQCPKGGNEGWHGDQDKIYAQWIPDGAVVVDGVLDDKIWQEMPDSRRYTDVPFAKDSGEIVVFESLNKGKWYAIYTDQLCH
jgi:hypothetical protein